MKLKGNGGYQIIDFEGQAPNTLDVVFFDNTIARGKPLWVNNLVVNGETYNGVASAKKTLTHIILIIATIQVVIALSDGATTYEEDTNILKLDYDISSQGNDFTTEQGNVINAIVKKAYENNKPLYINCDLTTTFTTIKCKGNVTIEKEGL